MFSRAVVATDLGPSSEGIVACAGALGVLGVHEAILVYAIDLEHGPSAAEDAAFARQAASLEAAGVTVHVETPLGYAPHAITSFATERDAGLIVMGTHGKGLFHTGFSGSVSSDVVRLSLVPVLLAPAPQMDSADSGTATCARLLSSVLVPVLDGPLAQRVCTLVCSLNRYGIQSLELVHVVEMSFEAVREGREARGRELLEDLARQARATTTAAVTTTLLRGQPDDEIARLASSGRYSLVVMAPRCHDTIDQAFDSVTSSVIRSANIPILLAPPECDVLPQPRGNT